MPVIDGNLAAQRIRALPNANARIPIFAVTAGEDACAVSFTGILRKPLSRGRIAMALRRVSKQMALGHALKSDAAMVANEVNATCTVDSEIVLEALEFVNAKVRDAMIVRFEAECVRLCRDIQGAVEQEDVTVARSRSHALAGLMGQFGLVAASKVASQIARTAEPQRCLVSTANLAPAVSRGLLEFRRVVGGPGFFAVS